MFKCLDCGHEFEEPKTIYVTEGEWDRRYEVCPRCEGAFKEFERMCGTCKWADPEKTFFCTEVNEIVHEDDPGCEYYRWEEM